MSATAGRRLEPDRLALIDAREDGDRLITYGELRALSNQTANLLAEQGVARGDRVGILLPQTPETAYAHIAVYKLGAIAIPLFTLFGAEALEHRLANAGAKAVITNRDGAAKLVGLREKLPQLRLILGIDGAGEGGCRFSRAAPCAAGRVRGGEDEGRGPRADHLHLRHHGVAQRRSPRSSRAARPSARR